MINHAKVFQSSIICVYVVAFSKVRGKENSSMLSHCLHFRKVLPVVLKVIIAFFGR